MIFVDTGAWFASVVPSDVDHAAASQWLKEKTERLLTTDYIINETLTLLRARGESTRAIRMGEQFFGGALAKVYFLTEDDILATWEVFRKFSDKDWSFMDCSSKVVMERMGITRAFCFDHHFVRF